MPTVTLAWQCSQPNLQLYLPSAVCQNSVRASRAPPAAEEQRQIRGAYCWRMACDVVLGSAFLANVRLIPDPYGPAPIWRACRRLNAESLLFLYSSNIFTWGNIWEMRKWLKERLPTQKRAIARLHLEWTMTETQWKHMEGVNTLYHSTKGTVSCNPWDSGIFKNHR